MIIFPVLFEYIPLYIRIQWAPLFWSVLACSLDCMAAQTRRNQKNIYTTKIEKKGVTRT